MEGPPIRSLDHLPVLLLVGGVVNRLRRWQPTFRFEASWVKEEEYEPRIRQEWLGGQSIGDPVRRVQN